MLIGYARVSTLDQNLDMQVRALEAAGCEKVFAEKVTGTTADRPEYNKLKEFARDGHDTIVVYKLDRLGRSLRNLIDEMQLFHNRNIGFKSVQEHIDTVLSHILKFKIGSDNFELKL
jgi:DNA invertase Pin-like site-specific DNA recombinase